MSGIHSFMDSNLMLILFGMLAYHGITPIDRNRIDAVTLLTHHKVRNLLVGYQTN